MFDKMKEMAGRVMSPLVTVDVDKGVVERIMDEGGEYFHDGILTIPPWYKGEILKGAFGDAVGKENITQVNTGSVTQICEFAFSSFSALKSVEMPKVTSIGDSAFDDCSALTSVTMPEVTSIESSAFRDCPALTSVTMPEVTNIESSAFRNCSALTSVEMPKVTSIGNCAFQECSALKSVTMPEVTSIGDWAFFPCHALTSVTMPEVTSIGDWAFFKCPYLREIHTNNQNICPIIVKCLRESEISDKQVTIYLNGEEWHPLEEQSGS